MLTPIQERIAHLYFCVYVHVLMCVCLCVCPHECVSVDCWYISLSSAQQHTVPALYTQCQHSSTQCQHTHTNTHTPYTQQSTSQLVYNVQYPSQLKACTPTCSAPSSSFSGQSLWQTALWLLGSAHPGVCVFVCACVCVCVCIHASYLSIHALYLSIIVIVLWCFDTLALLQITHAKCKDAGTYRLSTQNWRPRSCAYSCRPLHRWRRACP
jgi:hypothetical protein